MDEIVKQVGIHFPTGEILIPHVIAAALEYGDAAARIAGVFDAPLIHNTVLDARHVQVVERIIDEAEVFWILTPKRHDVLEPVREVNHVRGSISDELASRKAGASVENLGETERLVPIHHADAQHLALVYDALAQWRRRAVVQESQYSGTGGRTAGPQCDCSHQVRLVCSGRDGQDYVGVEGHTARPLGNLNCTLQNHLQASMKSFDLHRPIPLVITKQSCRTSNRQGFSIL